MNGVINIITRTAQDTLGTLAKLAVGDHDEDTAELRYGARRGDPPRTGLGEVLAPRRFRDAAGALDPRSVVRRARGNALRLAHGIGRRAHAAVGRVHAPDRGGFRAGPVPGSTSRSSRSPATTRSPAAAHACAPRAAKASPGLERAGLVRARAAPDRRASASRAAPRSSTARRWTTLGEHNQLIYGATVLRHSDSVDNGPGLHLRPGLARLAHGERVRAGHDGLGRRALGTPCSAPSSATTISWAGTCSRARACGGPRARARHCGAAVSRPVRVPSRFEENGLLVFSYVDTGLATGPSRERDRRARRRPRRRPDRFRAARGVRARATACASATRGRSTRPCSTTTTAR
jgi:hypothetical protein